MRSTVIAAIFCIVSAAADAQCVGQQASVTAAAQPGPALIRTAAAGTREPALSADDELPMVRETVTAAKTTEKPARRAGPVMLLAALAVMSGIALRRYTARLQ